MLADNVNEIDLDKRIPEIGGCGGIEQVIDLADDLFGNVGLM